MGPWSDRISVLIRDTRGPSPSLSPSPPTTLHVHILRKGHVRTQRRWQSASQEEELSPQLNRVQSWSRISSLQNCEKINFCCLSHPVCGIGLAKEFVWVFCNILRKNLNKLFGQPNIFFWQPKQTNILHKGATLFLSTFYSLYSALFFSTVFITTWHFLSSFVYCLYPLLEWKPPEAGTLSIWCTVVSSILKPVPGT